MNYKFPEIRHIDDVKHLAQDRDDFSIVEKEDFDVIDYQVAFSDTFPPVETENDAILREFRGLIFDKNGVLVRRPYHKFFNVDEREETRTLDLSRPHVILEKLDGSMIAPFMLKGEPYWATKMGALEFHENVEKFVKEHPEMEYEKFFRACYPNWTPIFEWVGPENRIVVGYREPSLILTGVRHNKFGTYLPYDGWTGIKSYAELFNIPVVKAYEGTFQNMEALQKHTSALENEEGYVVVFDDGHRAKIKGDWYCQLHKVKSYFDFEKDVVRLIMSGDLDDLRPMLLDFQVEKLDKYEVLLHTSFAKLKMTLFHEVENLLDYTNREERKDFAIRTSKDFPHVVRAIIFAYWDTINELWEDIDGILRMAFINSTTSGRRWEDFKKNNHIDLEW